MGAMHPDRRPFVRKAGGGKIDLATWRKAPVFGAFVPSNRLMIDGWIFKVAPIRKGR